MGDFERLNAEEDRLFDENRALRVDFHETAEALFKAQAENERLKVKVQRLMAAMEDVATADVDWEDTKDVFNELALVRSMAAAALVEAKSWAP